MWNAAARGALLGLAVLASVIGGTACSPDPPDTPRTATSTAVTARPVDTDSATTATATATATATGETNDVLPATLVGSWTSVEEADDTASIAYRFTGDGRYKYAGLIAYWVPEGVVKITFVAEGTARVDDEVLMLRPVTATRSMEDPRKPQDDYTDKPSSLDPERFEWQVTDGVLGLTDQSGNTVTYRRAQR